MSLYPPLVFATASAVGRAVLMEAGRLGLDTDVAAAASGQLLAQTGETLSH